MSLTSSLPTLANVGIRSASDVLRGRTLHSMARAVGVVLGAGLMAAVYQFSYEESRQLVHNMRQNGAYRRARNDRLMLVVLNSKLPIEMQEALRRSRDVVRACQKLLTHPALPPEHHAIIHAALTQLITGETDVG